MIESNQPIYQLEQVEKTYQHRRVLRIDQLTIYAGEILALVGPSGAGKSTLLRLLNFLEAPSTGDIRFHGSTFNSTTEMPLHLRRMVTTVFQRPMLLNRTVAGNVRFGLQLRQQNQTNEMVNTALQDVGLLHLAQQRAKRLSGGEAQRVSLARAMVLQPEVLLLDEPTANLDPYNVGLIETIIHQMNLTRRVTLVLVTHNIFQAKRLAHRVAFLLDGQIIEVLPNEQFFQEPNDARTAAFARGEMVY